MENSVFLEIEMIFELFNWSNDFFTKYTNKSLSILLYFTVFLFFSV